MAKLLYKYVGAGCLNQVLARPDRATLRCSYPRDFDDPYELFLTIDFDKEPEVLAFYEEVVGQVPQWPTTCFSRSPAVIPMWAHYAHDLTGMAIEFDEGGLAEAFPESTFGDVKYRDAPDEDLTKMLHMAYVARKPRHAYMLVKSVQHTAYFTKATCWSHELERRMVVGEGEVRREGALMLADAPAWCVSSLISGPRATEVTKRSLENYADRIGCRYFEMRTGRSPSEPYFLSRQGEPSVFDGAQVSPSEHYCLVCREPIRDGNDLCPWCRIKESHQQQAAASNPFRLIASAGLFESYVESMEAIDRELHQGTTDPV